MKRWDKLGGRGLRFSDGVLKHTLGNLISHHESILGSLRERFGGFASRTGSHSEPYEDTVPSIFAAHGAASGEV